MSEQGTTLHGWIAIFTALALFCLLQGAFWLLRARARRKGEQLGRVLRGQRAGEAAEGGIKLRRGSSTEASLVERIRVALERAGVTSIQRLAGRSAAVIGAVALLATVVTGSLGSGLAFGLLATIGVYYYVARRRARSIDQMRSQVPRALELMTFSLRAGHSLEEAIRLAAEEVAPPLSHELQRCHQESAMGRPIEAALEQLGGRWPEVRPLRFFVEAVSVLKRTGGNLVEVIDQIGANLRAQAAFAARHRALTAEGRMSGKILMALPFLSLLVEALTAPDQLRLMLRTGTGQTVMTAAAIFWVIGALWVRRLTRTR